MSLRTYEGRYLGGGRWEVRRRPRSVSGPVRAGFGVVVAAGCVVKVWRLMSGPDARAAQVAMSAAAVGAVGVLAGVEGRTVSRDVPATRPGRLKPS